MKLKIRETEGDRKESNSVGSHKSEVDKRWIMRRKRMQNEIWLAQRALFRWRGFDEAHDDGVFDVVTYIIDIVLIVDCIVMWIRR